MENRKVFLNDHSNLLELEELSSLLEETEEQARSFSLKERAAYMAEQLRNCAEKNRIELKLRKKGN